MWISLRIFFEKGSKTPIIGMFGAYRIKLVKAGGRGCVVFLQKGSPPLLEIFVEQSYLCRQALKPSVLWRKMKLWHGAFIFATIYRM